jgi:tetratricopeptide (TPR) repeat protein
LLERALAIKERHYGLDHPEVVATLTNLGNAYGSLGDTKKKHKFLEQALSIKERHYGFNHPEVTTISTNLGDPYESLGDIKKKHDMWERAWAINERHYGLDNPNKAITLTKHASLGAAQKKTQVPKTDIGNLRKTLSSRSSRSDD